MHPVFKMICVEELLELRQAEYYDALRRSDEVGSSEIFTEFMLQMILASLKNSNLPKKPEQRCIDRLNYAKTFFDRTTFGRKAYMAIFPNISSATASRDLQIGVKIGILKKINSNNRTIYKIQFPTVSP
jgi:Fic family protein